MDNAIRQLDRILEDTINMNEVPWFPIAATTKDIKVGRVVKTVMEITAVESGFESYSDAVFSCGVNCFIKLTEKAKENYTKLEPILVG
jgi:hypothetical protein